MDMHEPADDAYRFGPPPIVPPHNMEAEQSFLAALLADNRVYERVSEILTAEHFADPVHGRIFAAARKMIERGEPADVVTLFRLFDKDPALKEIGGGKQYLTKLASSVVTIINATDYARQIAELAARRALLAVGQDIVADAVAEDIDRPAAKRIEEAEQRLFDIAERRGLGGDQGPAHIAAANARAIEAAERVYKANGTILGVPSGLIDLDRTLGGFHDTDLVVIAGRPGMGKSALAANIAEGAALAGKRALYVSLEMSADQLSARFMARRTGVSADRQRKGPLTGGDMERLIAAQRELDRLPIEIDDEPAAAVAQLRSRARRLMRRGGLALIVVDYLQQMVDGRAENRVQEISKITRDLKVLAKQLGVPVIALSQLSRAVEAREDKRPMLSDLRESGSIEQDADIVIFVYRDEYYLKKAEPQQRTGEGQDAFANRLSSWNTRMEAVRGIGEAIIAKNRHGPERTVRLRWDGERTSFENLQQGTFL
jgi:replicative DNA helicase